MYSKYGFLKQLRVWNYCLGLSQGIMALLLFKTFSSFSEFVQGGHGTNWYMLTYFSIQRYTEESQTPQGWRSP